MSALESGRTSSSLEPLAEVMLTLTNGACSVLTLCMLEMVKCRTVSDFAGAFVGVGLCLRFLLQQTLAKWPTFWQWKHVWP